jgi:hypothetical protein
MAKKNQASTGEEPLSILALSRLLKVGRDTLSPALANVTPAGSKSGKPTWTESQARAALEAAGSRAATGPLKDQKLKEQIRQLKLQNDKKAGTLVEKTKMVSVMAAISSRIAEARTQSESQAPVRMVGKDIAELREEVRRIWDDVGRVLASCASEFQDRAK